MLRSSNCAFEVSLNSRSSNTCAFRAPVPAGYVQVDDAALLESPWQQVFDVGLEVTAVLGVFHDAAADDCYWIVPLRAQSDARADGQQSVSRIPQGMRPHNPRPNELDHASDHGRFLSRQLYSGRSDGQAGHFRFESKDAADFAGHAFRPGDHV